MPHPLVVHCKKSAFDVYVGRKSRGAPAGTTGEWGNPFAMRNASDAERDRVISQYEAWLIQQPDMINMARTELKGKRLACWCAPKPCHADVLARIANNQEEEEEGQPPPPQEQPQQIEATTMDNAVMDANEEAWPSLLEAAKRK